jgi:maltose alpha-D-glucosyltransferase / alpha-amylase
LLSKCYSGRAGRRHSEVQVIDELWYKNAIIYSLDVGTFLDTNGDGVGDLEGVNRRLEYLGYLGVDAIWLSPFHPSPRRDNGYDITDHYGVHADYGTSGDFVAFIHHARQHGFRVLMDLVVNHTSDEHPWFQHARSDPASPRRDWYIWSKKRPKNWNDGVVFPGVQERTWTYDRKAGEYYFHRFYSFQPDLNMDNAAVREEIHRIVGYWLELGVSGFRVDAVPFVLESVVPGRAKHDVKFEYLADLRQFLQWRQGDAILLGEANVLPQDMAPYFGEHGNGIHMMFNFFVNQHLFYALATHDIAPLADAIKATLGIPPAAQWAHFLRNHDELDLGRLSKAQRERVFARFAPAKNMQLYGRGIRRRLAPMLGDREHEELAYSMMFSLPGAVVIRFGDELRMGDNLGLKERDAVRTPMQWANEKHAGFTTADKPVHPVIDSGVWGYEHINVGAHRRAPDSFLNWMAAMIRVRKECPEIGLGRCSIIDTAAPNVLGLRYDYRGNTVITLHNFDAQPHEACLRLPEQDPCLLCNLVVAQDIHIRQDGSFEVPLDSLDYAWFRVGGLDYAARYSMAE